jgi:hypothetical protein
MDMQPRISLATTIGPLDWFVASDYGLVDFPGMTPKAPRRTLIVPRGGRQWRRYTIGADARTRVALIVNVRAEPQPVAGEHSIFLDLAAASCPRSNSPEASEAALAFVKKWGLLSAPSKDRPLESTTTAVLTRARLMRKALADAERNGCLPLKTTRFLRGVSLENGLTLQPRTLMQYCWLELFVAFKSGLRFYRCGNRECHKYGLLREPGRSGPDRQYCSDACRKKEERARTRARAA